jgi:nucleotide-binding universal stress UspA family protein
MTGNGSIVVGVDESAGAAEALRWAAGEGELHRWPVTAVLCWGSLDQHHGTMPHPFEPAFTAAEATAALHTIVARVLGKGAATVECRTVNDLAARGLLEASADATLLVLGARGLGSFRELMLGSVSQQCLHHATIPAAIVRADTTSPQHGRSWIVVGVDGSETSQRALGWALEEGRLRHVGVEVVHAWNPPTHAVPTLANAVPRGSVVQRVHPVDPNGFELRGGRFDDIEKRDRLSVGQRNDDVGATIDVLQYRGSRGRGHNLRHAAT